MGKEAVARVRLEVVPSADLLTALPLVFFNDLGRLPGLLDSLPRLNEATSKPPAKPSPLFPAQI